MPKRKTSPRRWMPPPQNILQLKIPLRHITPPIWRRVLVPDNWLLGDLHPVFVPS